MTIIEKDNLSDIPGVGPATALKLEAAGFTDFASIGVASSKEIAEKCEIGEATAVKIIAAARSMAKIGDFISASTLKEQRSKLRRLTTGSKALDNLFKNPRNDQGGLESASITEFFGEYGSGKCIGKDTPVLYFASGRARISSIADIFDKYTSELQEFDGGEVSAPKEPIEVMSFDSESGVVKQNVIGLYREKVNSIEEMTTNRGNVVHLTKKHPLLTITDNGLEWRSLGALSVGDYVAVPRCMDFGVEDALNEQDAYFLGMFVAEGGSNPLSICNTSPAIIKKVVDYSITKFGRAATVDGYDRVLLYKDFKKLLGDLASCNSGNMFIPESVLNADERIVAAFLAGYLDGDGHYGNVIEYVTKSKQLSVQMSYLLSKLGISVSLGERDIDGELYYRAYITDSASKHKLLDVLTEATKNLDILETKNGSTIYGIPSKPFMNISKRAFSKLSGTHRRGALHGKKALLDGKYGVVYSNYLAKTKAVSESITHESAELVFELLEEKLKILGKWHKQLESPTENGIFDALGELPFSTVEIVNELGINKATFNNYIIRKSIPNERIPCIANALRSLIEKRLSDKELFRDIDTLRILCSGTLGWERIKSVETKAYNDYVYDLTVDGTHNFIGGEKPLIMHNTQLCFQLAVNTTMPVERGGLDADALIIDTEGTFRPARIEQIAIAQDLDPDKVLDHIHVARAFNSAHQMLLLENKAYELAKECNVGLIIIDSLTSHFRSEFVGRGNLAERQGQLAKHMRELLRYTYLNNCVGVITNQVMANPGQLFGDPTKPVGGHVLGHASTNRLYLRKAGKGGKRNARMIDSPEVVEDEVIFVVSEAGIRDE